MRCTCKKYLILLLTANVVAEAAQLNTVKPIRDHDHGAKVLEVRHEPTNGIMSTAKTTLLFLKESSDAFPPLKSLVAGLLFLLENHEVHFLQPDHPQYLHTIIQEMEGKPG